MSFVAPPAGSDLRPHEVRSLEKNRVAFLALGGVLVALGIVALGAWCAATTFSVLLVGVLLFLGGGAQVANAVLSHGGRGFGLHLVAGIFNLILGLLMIRHPEGAADAITLMIAASLLISGAFLVVTAAMERFHGWPWFLGNGALNLLMGAIIWATWRESGAWVIGMFLGIELIYVGSAWIALALAVPTPAGSTPTVSGSPLAP